MAMMNCPECGKKIIDGAKTCPECGWENPMLRKKEIKRGLGKGLGIAAIIIGVLLMVVVFAANAAWGPGAPSREDGFVTAAFIFMIAGAVIIFLNRKK